MDGRRFNVGAVDVDWFDFRFSVFWVVFFSIIRVGGCFCYDGVKNSVRVGFMVLCVSFDFETHLLLATTLDILSSR